MIVNAEHKNMFIAHHDEGDAYACIDACVDKLERQLTDHKKKIRNRKHPEADAKSGECEEVPVVEWPVVSGRQAATNGTDDWQLTTDN